MLNQIARKSLVATLLASTLAWSAHAETQCYDRDYTVKNPNGAPLGLVDYLANAQDGSDIYRLKGSVLDGSFFQSPYEIQRTQVQRARLVVTHRGRMADAQFTLFFTNANGMKEQMYASFECQNVGASFICSDFTGSGANFLLNPGKNGYDVQVDSKRGGKNLSHLVMYTWGGLEGDYATGGLPGLVDGEIDNIAVIAPDVFNLKKDACSEAEDLS